MFKHLGRFSVLAVCLFALAMVGCGNGDEKIDPPIVPPVEEKQVELTPMEKLTGTWSLVESTGVDGDGDVLRQDVSGQLILRPEGNGWLVTYVDEDGDSRGNSGQTWSANATTITFIVSGGERFVERYTLEGSFLTVSSFDEDLAFVEKWRKD